MPKRKYHFFIWGAAAGLYAPVFVQLYQGRWEYVDYSHAYFILPGALWLAWRKRHSLTQVTVKSKPFAFSLFPFPFLLLLGLLMFLFGWRQDYLFISTASLIPVLFGLIGFVYGPAAARVMAFPILYLILLIPPPLALLDGITMPMRQMTTTLATAILQAIHFPITRDGLMLSVGGHQIYMGPACSGFRSLITMISLGLVYAYMIKAPRRAKMILAASIIPLALAGNLIRVISVCLVTHHFGEAAGAKYHDASGFVIFLILIAGLMGIEHLLQTGRARILPVPKGTGSNFAPVHSRQNWCLSPFFRTAAATFLILSTALAAYALPRNKYAGTDILTRLDVPLTFDDWQGTDISGQLNLNDLNYNFISQIVARVYSHTPSGAQLLLLLLDGRNVHQPKVCLTGAGNEITELPDIQLTARGKTFPARLLRSRKGADNTLMIYWLCIDKQTGAWTRMKFKQLMLSLLNKKNAGLMVRVEIPCTTEHEREAVAFARYFIASVANQLPPDQAEYLFGKK